MKRGILHAVVLKTKITLTKFQRCDFRRQLSATVDKPCCFRTSIFIDRCIVLWTNQVLPLLVQRDSLNTSRSKDRTVSLFFLPKPLHSPHPLGSYIALPSSRSLLKTKMAKVCARSRRSNGKKGDCEQSTDWRRLTMAHLTRPAEISGVSAGSFPETAAGNRAYM